MQPDTDADVTVTRSEIAQGLRALGVDAGDVLLVHSSLKSFGRVEGGADAVIDALLEAVGPTGTVMVPTITGTAEHSPANPPVFDVRNTPCWTGTIPETFRRRPDAVRSLHPTHSVAAIGPQSDFLTRDHLDSPTPCGPRSPYLRLTELDGNVVFLGVSLECCTLLHAVEEIAECEYHMQPAPALATIIDAGGKRFRKAVRLHQWGTRRRFSALEPTLLREGVMRVGPIGKSRIRIVDARPLVDRTLEILKKDRFALCAVSRGQLS